MVLNKDHETKKAFFRRLRKWSLVTFVTSVTWGLLLDVKKEKEKTAQELMAEYIRQHQADVPHFSLDELEADDEDNIYLEEEV
jgi:hypothetical protein